MQSKEIKTVTESIERKLRQSEGGSLFNKEPVLETYPHQGSLFIGLGGLGGATINAMKAAYEKNFKPAGNVRFLAVDTDISDLEKLIAGNSGRYVPGALAPEETFPLFSRKQEP